MRIQIYYLLVLLFGIVISYSAEPIRLYIFPDNDSFWIYAIVMMFIFLTAALVVLFIEKWLIKIGYLKVGDRSKSD